MPHAPNASGRSEWEIMDITTPKTQGIWIAHFSALGETIFWRDLIVGAKVNAHVRGILKQVGLSSWNNNEPTADIELSEVTAGKEKGE